jgi:hypothetical protein
MTGPDTNRQDTRPAVTTHPLLGVAGVLLGALIATCMSRLMSMGLADIRGALYLGVDERSWINTAFNASPMFIGPLSVCLGGFLGLGRVLLACARIFTAVSFLIPFCHSLEVVIAPLIIAGLSAGTFYPLTLCFVLRNLLWLQLRQEAYTLAISDSFLRLAKCCVACLAVVSFMFKVPTQYLKVTATPVEAKMRAHSTKGDRL